MDGRSLKIILKLAPPKTHFSTWKSVSLSLSDVGSPLVRALPWFSFAASMFAARARTQHRRRSRPPNSISGTSRAPWKAKCQTRVDPRGVGRTRLCLGSVRRSPPNGTVHRDGTLGTSSEVSDPLHGIGRLGPGYLTRAFR